MAKAYLKIDIETGKEIEVKAALKKVSGVKSADFVTGAHDLLASVEGKNYEEIVTKTLAEIRKVKGIKRRQQTSCLNGLDTENNSLKNRKRPDLR
ncbi:MAG: Lrp/AsnC ligand binding domain-containing protein [Methanoregula sp.]|nr:Lrp/AsnC ligand binding domain-containing protein [Methanoregula sp.]